MAGDDDLLFRLEQQWRDDRERVRALLREEGREDLIAEYDAKLKAFSLSTARNLIARGLLACDGGAHDPEAKLIITELGRFVLKHGPSGAGKGYRS